MDRIITIGREFGSGGRELGRRLAENLGYAYYDQEILEEIAGEKIVGHRAPTGMLHTYSFELMQKRGYLYSSVMKDRDWAYLHQPIKELPPVVELPTEHTLDDYTYFSFSFAAPKSSSSLQYLSVRV